MYSDPVIIALIGAVASFAMAALAAVGSFANNMIARENRRVLTEQAGIISTLEKNTNSIKDQLVEATKGKGEAEGNLQGRREALAELQAAQVQQPAQPVVVINPDPIDVAVTKTKGKA